MIHRSVPILVLGLVWLTSPPIGAADSFEQYEWLQRGEPDLGVQIDNAQLTLPPERLDELEEAGYGYVDLLWRYELTISAGGEHTLRDFSVRHFLSGIGIQEGGSFVHRVRGGSTTQYIDEAFVRMPTGDRLDLDLGTVQVVTDPSIDVFSDRFLVVVPFEGLVPGATAILVRRSKMKTREWPLPWSHLLYTRWLIPIERIEVIVRWETGVEEPMWITNDDRLDCEKSSGRELRCTATRIDPLPSDPDVRSFYDIAPHLAISQPQTWSTLAESAKRLLDQSRIETGPIQPLLERLLNDASTPAEKLNRIHRYVADEIRYVGLEQGIAAVSPASVAQTIARRYADCKGKVALFLELADRARIDAWGVLVATEHSTLDRLIVPSWLYFDHMIACARVDPDGEPLCTDLTDPNADTGQLAPPLYGALALDLGTDATAPRAFDVPEFVWELQSQYVNRVDCEGRLTEELSRDYSGPGAVAFRGLLRGMSAEERNRFIEEEFHEVMGGETASTFHFEGLDDPTSGVIIHSTTEFPAIPGDEWSEYVDIDAWLLHFAKSFSTENRHFAYLLDGVRIRTSHRYRLCPNHKVRFTGARLQFESEFGSLRRHYAQEGRTVKVETVFEMPRATIDVTQLARFQRFLESSLGQSRIWFALER